MQYLTGHLRHYDWGSTDAIAVLAGRTPSGRPEAELWFGAHPSGPACIGVKAAKLDAFIARNRVAALGPTVANRFGVLPFLTKILAAEQPLSIQLHPNKHQAEMGYAAEDDGQIALDAPNRTYRDPNHKPELICALTPFEARCGFRTAVETQAFLHELVRGSREVSLLPADHPFSEWVRYLEQVAAGNDTTTNLADVVGWLLRLTPNKAEALVGVLQRSSQTWVSNGGSGVSGAKYLELDAVARWTQKLVAQYPGDPGVAVAFLLNHVTLAPSEALFLPAGELHCYLHGTAVEVMANSDNVVRGGLTPKHIDLEELLVLLNPKPSIPSRQSPSSQVFQYNTPVPDFSVTRYQGPLTVDITPTGPEILLATSPRAWVGNQDRQLALESGQAGFVGVADGRYQLSLESEASVVWRTTAGNLDQRETARMSAAHRS